METSQLRNPISATVLQTGGPLQRWLCLVLMVLNRLKSFNLQNILTVFTMAIGAMALSATFFVGDGALKLLWKDLDRLLGDHVVVFADAGPRDILLKKRSQSDFTLEDLSFVKEKLTDARYVAPCYFGRAIIASEHTGMPLSIDGITAIQTGDPAFTPILGQRFSKEAQEGLVLECMLTESALDILNLAFKPPLTLRIESYRFHVIGVVPDPPEADERFKPRVVVPYVTAQHIWGKADLTETIIVAWQRPDQIDATITTLKKALDQCRAKDAYHLSSSSFRIKKRKNIVSNFMVVGFSQALFCILIAAIGTLNVMLASVVRRSKEFAIRITMGARRGEIMAMVLAESLFLGLFGAACGIVMAVFTAEPLCGFFSSKIAGASQLQPYIGLKGIIIPILVCSISGLVAGIVPAVKAGRMDILTVLRAE